MARTIRDACKKGDADDDPTPDTGVPLVPDPDLNRADKYLKEGRLVKPSKENAFEYYEKLLSSDATELVDASHKGLKNIIKRAENFVDDGHFTKAADIFAKLPPRLFDRR